MQGRVLRQKLHAGERVYGIALEGYGQPRFPRYFADVGLDFVWLDSEHAPNNRETIAWALQLYAAHNVAPFLRIPEISASQAAMGMDAGAHGIIAPYVETVEQVKALVGAVKYRPLKGAALTAAVEEGVFPNDQTRAYLDSYNPDATLIIMTESPAGVANLPDLLKVPGVDAVMIGPHDLSISHGVPEQYDHPIFVSALERVIATCQAHHVGVGMHFISGSVDWALGWARKGFNFISYRGDTLFVARGIQGELHAIRASLEGTPDSTDTDSIGASGHIHYRTEGRK
ncbi:MAG: aldolase [Anaerolineae bacterium]|nr:aldolase [Anaerolineae bacterium]